MGKTNKYIGKSFAWGYRSLAGIAIAEGMFITGDKSIWSKQASSKAYVPWAKKKKNKQ